MTKYNVSGMSCAACSARVERAVSAVEGVSSCAVSLLTNSMGVEGTATPQAIIAAVEAAGYGASLAGRDPSASCPGRAGGAREDGLPGDNGFRALRTRLLVSVVFLILLMYLSMGHVMWGFPLPRALADDPVALGLAELLLAAAIAVINGRFFTSGFKALLHRAPNMDTLVALGATAAFVFSTCVLFAMSGAQAAGDAESAFRRLHELYFESTGMILTLITVGKMLEARAKGKTTDALRALMRLSPKTATLLRDGNEVTVPIGEVRPGDLFAVRPGENVPVDGVITEGESALDESALTGESLPVDKSVGAAVSAGTVNRSGYLVCRATRVGEDTTLSQIIRMVSDAAATKAPIAKVADRVSGVFVPVVIGIATVTAAVWLLIGREIGFSLARGISVLVISCPCALGLATPVAIMVGSGVGAKNGILFKTAASLEAAGRVGTVVLDKTGTVTVGKPTLTDLFPADGVDGDRLLSLAASLEAKSEHPLSCAVLGACEAKGLPTEPVEGFAALPGKGLRATLNGKELIGGNASLVGESVSLPAAALERADDVAAEGKTPLHFAYDGSYLGMIAVADVLKEDSRSAISELHGMGIRVVMLTGDNERTARAIGGAAGVDEVIADVLPDGKERVIRDLQAADTNGGRSFVAMVGDGINDAPALTRADLGMAIGAGTDVAIDAADLVLVKSRLSDVPAAIRLGRATLCNIRENLFWAFFYNTVGIPIAAGAFVALGLTLNPMIGAAAMSLSSFCVVSNALRLNLVRPHDPRHDRKRKIKQKNSKNKVKKEKKPMEITILTEGLMCPHCEAHVKKALEALEGVTEAKADHVSGKVVLTTAAPVAEAKIKAAVEEAGYTFVKVL